MCTASKHRLHIDIRVAGEQQVDQAQRVEWIPAESYDGRLGQVVMLDPEDDEFCIA